MAFTNSPLVDYTRISPNRTINRKNKIDTITIHCVVGQCSVETLGAVFAPTSRQASSNYGIGYDGKVGMYCEEKDRSWCSSSGANDHRAITIEVASDTTAPYRVNAKAYATLIELCADICKRNGIKKLIWKADKSLIGQPDKQNLTVHRWFANKSCPGGYLYDLHSQIAKEVNAKLGVVEDVQDEADAPVTALSFKAGDVVKITGNTYYSGKSVPTWVKNKTWIVYSAAGDRVVVNKSEDGKSAIMSPFKACDLTVAKTAAVPSVTGTASTGNAIDEKKIWDYLFAKIGNAYGVAGLMGNLYAESGLRSNNLQNTYEKSLGMADAVYTSVVDAGTYTNFVRDSAGYGLAQWTYWSRKEALLKYAQSKKKSIGDLDMQLDFLWQELTTSYKTVVNELRTATNVLDASNSVLLKFERPANQGTSAQKKRAEYGQKYYDKYAPKSTDNNQSDKPSTSTTTTDTKPAETSKLKFAVGNIVNFIGGKHYKSADALLGTSVKASRAKITAVSKNGKHQYHCRAVNNAGDYIGGVYGWVDESTLQSVGAASNTTSTAEWTPKVGDTVNYKGNVHYSNANAAQGIACKGGKAKITSIYKLGKSKHPYHLVRVSGSGATVYGWVDENSFTKL